MEVLLTIMDLAGMLMPLFSLALILIGVVLASRWINANLAIHENKHQSQQEQKVLINELIDTLKKRKQMV